MNQPIGDCRLFMVFDGRWKYIHATGFRPLLFDLATDPQEFHDLGADPRYASEGARLREALLDWALRDHNRITMPDRRIEAYARRPAAQIRHSDRLLGRGRTRCRQAHGSGPTERCVDDRFGSGCRRNS